MRALVLRVDDSELFKHGSFDIEIVKFYHKHVEALKTMWADEGKCYWLRFLLTFKWNFEESLPKSDGICLDLLNDPSLYYAISFPLTVIHKQFIESSCNSAKSLIENIFTVVRYMRDIHEHELSKSPFYAKESKGAFHNLFGRPDINESIPHSRIFFIGCIYAEFACAIMRLLKRWVKEQDLFEDEIKAIDYTKFYWRPHITWEDSPITCFERYLADYWKDKLPKMLLTCDIHNIFSVHKMDFCCDSYKGEMNVFNLIDFEINAVKVLNEVGILPMDLVRCNVHSNCCLKIVHDFSCSQPYLCDGTATHKCIVSCDVINQQKISKQKFTWIKVESKYAKQSKSKDVYTIAESSLIKIETFKKNVSCKNNLTSVDKKDRLKGKLKEHVSFNRYFDTKNNTYNIDHLYADARNNFLREIQDESTISLNGHIICGHLEELMFDSFIKHHKAYRTIAIGTKDILFGRIVCSTKQFCLPALNCRQSLFADADLLCNPSGLKEELSVNLENLELSKNECLKLKTKICNLDGQKEELSAEVEDLELSENPCSKLKTKKARSRKKKKMNKHENVSNEISSDHPSIFSSNNDLNLSIKTFCDALNTNIKFPVENKCNIDSISESSNKEIITLNKSSHNVTESSKMQGKFIAKSDGNIFITSNHVENVFNNLQNYHVSENNVEVVSDDDGKVILDLVNNIIEEDNTSNSLTLGSKDSLNQTRDLPALGVVGQEKENKNASGDTSKSSSSVDVQEAHVNAFFELIGVTNISDQQSVITNGVTLKEYKEKRRKVCAFCCKKEEIYKSFKRCARCKEENFPEQHYYCSRECQINDWEESHRYEHLQYNPS